MCERVCDYSILGKYLFLVELGDRDDVLFVQTAVGNYTGPLGVRSGTTELSGKRR